MEHSIALWSLHVSRSLLFSFQVLGILFFNHSLIYRYLSNHFFSADGLWDVMGNQEVNDMVLQVMDEFDPSHGITWEEGGAYQEAAQMLTHEAYIRGSLDNIGVCVIAMG